MVSIKAKTNGKKHVERKGDRREAFGFTGWPEKEKRLSKISNGMIVCIKCSRSVPKGKTYINIEKSPSHAGCLTSTDKKIPGVRKQLIEVQKKNIQSKKVVAKKKKTDQIAAKESSCTVCHNKIWIGQDIQWLNGSHRHKTCRRPAQNTDLQSS